MSEVKSSSWPIVRLAGGSVTTDPGKIKVKASGCIRTRERFFELIDMGVDRMGIGFRSTPEVLGCAPKTLDPAA
jgi:deoxyribose-phosphate aldolase